MEPWEGGEGWEDGLLTKTRTHTSGWWEKRKKPFVTRTPQQRVRKEIRVRGLLPERTMVSLRASGGWGGRYNWFLLLLSSFRTGDVLVTSGTCSWDVPRGGPHLGSKGLGGGLPGSGSGSWILNVNET